MRDLVMPLLFMLLGLPALIAGYLFEIISVAFTRGREFADDHINAE